MAGLIEQAMWRAVQPKSLLPAELPAKLPAVRSAFEEAPGSAERFTERRPIFYAIGKNAFRRCGAALAAARQSPAFRRPGLLAEIMVQRATEVLANKPLRSLALSAVAIGLGLTPGMGRGCAGVACAC